MSLFGDKVSLCSWGFPGTHCIWAVKLRISLHQLWITGEHHNPWLLRFLFILFLPQWDIEPRSLHIAGKCSTTKLRAWPFKDILFWDSASPSSQNSGLCHQASFLLLPNSLKMDVPHFIILKRSCSETQKSLSVWQMFIDGLTFNWLFIIAAKLCCKMYRSISLAFRGFSPQVHLSFRGQ